MKGVCRKGHPVVGNNAYKVPSSGVLRCLACKRAYNLQWHRENRGSSWTVEMYTAAMEKQNGKCVICGKPPDAGKSLHGDHNHKTGQSRELLCSHCNMVLGVIEDDSRFPKALEYLQKHNAQ